MNSWLGLVVILGLSFGEIFESHNWYYGISLRQCQNLAKNVCYSTDIFFCFYDEIEELLPSNEEEQYFVSNQTYHFKYNVQTEGSAIGTTDRNTGLDIACDVDVHAKGHGKYVLQVPRCDLSEMTKMATVGSLAYESHPNSGQFSTAMKQNPVLFSIVDGSVQGLLAHEDEPLSILNVKRGIITALLSKTRSKINQNEDADMRVDVHGTCPVKYRKADLTVTMVKDMPRCHFPSRVNWPYSPLSLFWNMSFIQMFWINSSAECTYKFNYAGELVGTLCKERHAIRLESTKDTKISVQTNIRQELALDYTAPLQQVYYEKNSYKLTSIKYQYEKIITPRSNPPNLKDAVKFLVDKIDIDDRSSIEPETVNAFEELIQMLRKASDLSEIGEKFDFNKETKKAKVWRDSLIQCNRSPCIRAFRKLVESDTQNKAVGQAYIAFIYFTWTNAQLDDAAVLEEILMLTIYLQSVDTTFSRFRTLALSSIAATFSKTMIDEDKYKVIPKVLNSIIEFVTKPMTDQCVPEKGYTEDDVIGALIALRNMGYAYNKINYRFPDKLRACITNKKAPWSASVLAIQVKRRMMTSETLRHFLVSILRNSDLKHEDHVWAYLLLAEKFGDEELVKEVMQFLKVHRDTGLNFNLKTFIVSHMRAVAKSRDPNRVRYAKAIREALATSPDLFRIIPEETLIEANKEDNPKLDDSKGIPFDIHTDEELKLSDGFFSKYEEEDHSYGSSFLRDSINRFGYGYSKSTLTDGKSYLPFAFWTDGLLQLFSKKFIFDNIAAYSRNFPPLVQAMRLGNGNVREIFQSYFANRFTLPQNMDGKYDKKSNVPYPFNVEPNILRNLEKLQASITQSISEPSMKDIATLVSFGFLDDILVFKNTPANNLNAHSGLKHQSDSISSNYWKVVDAFNLVPTMLGLPLNWTTDAYLIHTSNHTRLGTGSFFAPDLKTTNSISALAALKNGMTLDLPGFASHGIQSFSTISTSVGADIDLKLNIPEKKFKVRVEFPKRPMQLLSLTRKNFLMRNGQVEEILDWDLDRVTENWCSYNLISILGMKVCHSKSYPNVTHRDDKPWTLMAGSSNWNFSVGSTESQRIIQFGVNITDEEDGETQTIEADVQIPDGKAANKFIDMLRVVHKRKLVTTEFQTKIGTPFFHVKAFKELLEGGSGYHFRVEAQPFSGQATILDYTTITMVQQKSEETIKNRLSKTPNSKMTLVPVTESKLNLTTSENYYGFTYKQQEFPLTTYSNHNFRYKSLNPRGKPWLRQLIRHDIFWEDSHSGWVELYQEANHPDVKAPSAMSYSYLKIPKSIIEVRTFNGPTPTAVNRIDFNLTKYYLSNYTAATYFNFTTSIAHKLQNGVRTTVHDLNLVNPSFSMTSKLTFKHALGPPGCFNLTWMLKRTEQPHNHPESMESIPQNPSTSTMELDINVKDDELPEWETKKAFRDPYALFMSAAKKNVSTSFTYYRKVTDERPTFQAFFNSTTLYFLPYEARYRRNFLLLILPTEYMHQVDSDFIFHNDMILWQFNFTSLPMNYQHVRYIFKSYIPPRSELLYLTEKLAMTYYNRTTSFVTRYETLFSPNLNLDMNITTSSQVEPLLNMDLRQQVANEGEVMKMVHQLLDIDVSANWQTGYKKTFNFNSKNKYIIPNMVWTIDYPDQDNGTTIEFKFPDASLSYFLIGRKKFDSTQLVFTICHNKMCNSDNEESETFVAEVEMSLENSKRLTRTVIYNPYQLGQLQFQVMTIVNRVLSSFAHAKSAPIFQSMAVHIIAAAKSPVEEIRNFFRNFFIIHDYALIYAPSIDIAIQSGKYFLGPTLRESYIVWFWNYYNVKDQILPWTAQIASRIANEYLYRPGPVLGKSYVSTITLPVYWTKFTTYPQQWNPAMVQYLLDLYGKWTGHSSPVRHYYQDVKYSRHAMINANGDMYTFDGRISHILQKIIRPQCAYLLSQDIGKRKFTIYLQYPDIHILFPDTSLRISVTGQVAVNGTAKDLPFEHWNGDFRAIFDDDRLVLTTKYDLKIICHYHDRYCLFYTNKYTFNQLIGLLGNNNDNPMDDVKDNLKMELTGDPYCATPDDSAYQCHDDEHEVKFQWFDILWKYNSPTLPCHDVISIKDFLGHRHAQCPNVPLSLVSSYLALCGSKGIPAGIIPRVSCKPGEQLTVKVAGELEVVFVVDQSYRPSDGNFLKSVTTLVQAIHKQFHDDGYEKIQFRLVGFRGRSFKYVPHQHTANGKVLSTITDFVGAGLKTLEFAGARDNNATAAIAALKYAAEHSLLSPKAVHVFIVITQEDKDIPDVSFVHETLLSINRQTGTVYTFSSYPSAARSKGIYGIRGDGYVFPQPKAKDELFVDYPKGQLAKLSSATRGAIWQLSYLEDTDIPPKRYIQAIGQEVAARARQEQGLERECPCSAEDIRQQMTSCKFKLM